MDWGDSAWDVDAAADSLNVSLFGNRKTGSRKIKADVTVKSSADTSQGQGQGWDTDDDNEHFSKKAKKKLKKRRGKENKRNKALQESSENKEEEDSATKTDERKEQKNKKKSKLENGLSPPTGKLKETLSKGTDAENVKKKKKKKKTSEVSDQVQISKSDSTSGNAEGKSGKEEKKKKKRKISQSDDADVVNVPSKQQKTDEDKDSASGEEQTPKKKRRKRKKKSNSDKNKFKHLGSQTQAEKRKLVFGIKDGEKDVVHVEKPPNLAKQNKKADQNPDKKLENKKRKMSETEEAEPSKKRKMSNGLPKKRSEAETINIDTESSENVLEKKLKKKKAAKSEICEKEEKTAKSNRKKKKDESEISLQQSPPSVDNVEPANEKKSKKQKKSAKNNVKDENSAKETVNGLDHGKEKISSESKSSPFFQSDGGDLKQKMMDKLTSGRFRFINEQLYTIKGGEALRMFHQDKSLIEAYHAGFQSQAKQWPTNPLDVIVKQLKAKSEHLVVADFGCGEAKLSASVPQKVHSFDLYALNDRVTVCDMSKTPLSSGSVDVAVFCLSLMGTNLSDYVLEANRVLKDGGLLKIAEVSSRFSSPNHFISSVSSLGFKAINTRELGTMFYLMDFKKVKSVGKSSKAVKSFSLKPCLYKKR